MKFTEDSDLIHRFKDGDMSAFEEIVRKHQDRIYNICRYMLGNTQDSEDAAQDVFIKAYRNIKNFKPKASLYTWLYRIAINQCIDYRRRPFMESIFRKSAQGEEYILEPPSSNLSPERLYESRQISDVIQISLDKLSPKLRAVIVLKENEGLSYNEIAETLEISVGTVKSRISRAREELKKLMKEFTEQI